MERRLRWVPGDPGERGDRRNETDDRITGTQGLREGGSTGFFEMVEKTVKNPSRKRPCITSVRNDARLWLLLLETLRGRAYTLRLAGKGPRTAFQTEHPCKEQTRDAASRGAFSAKAQALAAGRLQEKLRTRPANRGFITRIRPILPNFIEIEHLPRGIYHVESLQNL